MHSYFFLLDGANAATAGAEAAAKAGTVDIADLVFKGWYIYLPLLLMSLITVYIFVERWLTLSKASKRRQFIHVEH